MKRFKNKSLLKCRLNLIIIVQWESKNMSYVNVKVKKTEVFLKILWKNTQKLSFLNLEEKEKKTTAAGKKTLLSDDPLENMLASEDDGISMKILIKVIIHEKIYYFLLIFF